MIIGGTYCSGPREKSQSRTAFDSAAHASPGGSSKDQAAREHSKEPSGPAPTLPGNQEPLSQSLRTWEVEDIGWTPGGKAASGSLTPEGHEKTTEIARKLCLRNNAQINKELQTTLSQSLSGEV